MSAVPTRPIYVYWFHGFLCGVIVGLLPTIGLLVGWWLS